MSQSSSLILQHSRLSLENLQLKRTIQRQRAQSIRERNALLIDLNSKQQLFQNNLRIQNLLHENQKTDLKKKFQSKNQANPEQQNDVRPPLTLRIQNRQDRLVQQLKSQLSQAREKLRQQQREQACSQQKYLAHSRQLQREVNRLEEQSEKWKKSYQQSQAKLKQREQLHVRQVEALRQEITRLSRGGERWAKQNRDGRARGDQLF